jgi:hypothetical protein
VFFIDSCALAAFFRAVRAHDQEARRSLRALLGRKRTHACSRRKPPAADPGRALSVSRTSLHGLPSRHPKVVATYVEGVPIFSWPPSVVSANRLPLDASPGQPRVVVDNVVHVRRADVSQRDSDAMNSATKVETYAVATGDVAIAFTVGHVASASASKSKSGSTP